MKRWEEQQRMKQYANRIQQAKPTLVTQPKRARQSTASLYGQSGGRMVSLNSAGTIFSSSEDMVYQQQQHQPNEVPLFLSDMTSAAADNLYLLQSPQHANIQMQQHTPMSAGNNFHQHHLLMSTNSNNNITESTSSSKSRQEQPIFQLLKAFKLQQYAGKLTEVGYGQDIYKLALLNEQQRQDLITQLKVLPGHKAKLLSLFDVIDELYPRKKIMEQLKHYSTPPQQNPFIVATSKHSQRQHGQLKRAQTTGNQGFRPQRASGTSYGQRGQQQQQRSLMKEYEALDPLTKQAFNNTFLMNMESVKYSIPQLFQQHFNNEDHVNAINQIFPPSYYYGAVQQQQPSLPQEQVQWGPTYGYDHEEVQLLVTKYVGRAATLSNSQQPTIASSSTATQNNRKSKERSTSANRQKEEELHLKQEMAQALKVIERVNKEIEHMTKASQKEYENIKEQNSKQYYGRQMTGGSTKNNTSNSITQESQASSNYLKRKPTTTSSVQQSKPSSVQSTKGPANPVQQPSLLQKQNTLLATQPKPAIVNQQYPKPSSVSQQDSTKHLGRFQSNRALARERERQHMIQHQPQRVITEHEIASETTTPQTSKLAVISQKESSSDKRSSQMPLFNSSALSAKEQQEPANLTSVKKCDQDMRGEDGSHGIQFETAERKQLVNRMEVEECEEVKITQSTNAKIEEVKTLQTQPIEEEPSLVDTDVIKPFVLEDDDSHDKAASVSHDQEQKQNEMNEEIGSPQILQQARPERKLSPLLEKEERELLWNNALGHSLDSKQVVSALGYLDLKQICLCLAHALNRHIQFSQGFYFLDDLQEQIKQLHLEDHFKLDFSYELDPRFKIDIEAAKEKQKSKTAEQQEQSRREFEELKQQMAEQQQIGGNKVFDYAPQARKQISPSDLAGCEDTFERDENENIEYGMEDRDDQSDDDSAGERDNDNEQYIQDFYGNHSGATTDAKNKANKPPSELIKINQKCATVTHTDGDQMKEDEAIDLDYSYSHLEDFLRSQRHQGSMISGPQITSINSALIVDSHKKSHAAANGPNATSTTTQQLMNTFLTSYNKNKGGISARTNNQPLQEVIKEAEQKGDESGSHETPPINNNSSIIKPFFQLQPVQQLPATEEKREVDRSKINALAVLGMGSENSFTSSMADSLKIDVRTKEGFKDLIRFQMRIFDYNYDFESDTVVEEIVNDEFPTLEELYYYCKYVIISGRMEKEIPILCLVYLERFLTKTGILLNHLNWRRLTLISLCLASKIWDDDSLENVHFPKVMPDITLKEIASLEKVFLQFLDFDLLLRGAEYAKYYFILKTFAGEQSFNSCLPPVGPLTTQKMSELQNNTAKVESELRDKYHVKISLQKTM